MEADNSAISAARFSAALRRLVFLYGAVLCDALAAGLFGDGYVVVSA